MDIKKFDISFESIYNEILLLSKCLVDSKNSCRINDKKIKYEMLYKCFVYTISNIEEYEKFEQYNKKYDHPFLRALRLNPEECIMIILESTSSKESNKNLTEKLVFEIISILTSKIKVKSYKTCFNAYNKELTDVLKYCNNFETLCKILISTLNIYHVKIYNLIQTIVAKILVFIDKEKNIQEICSNKIIFLSYFHTNEFKTYKDTILEKLNNRLNELKTNVKNIPKEETSKEETSKENITVEFIDLEPLPIETFVDDFDFNSF